MKEERGAPPEALMHDQHDHPHTPGAEALTRNQTVVLAVLEAAARPLGAYQILEQTTPGGVRAPAQVYRALERLVELGLVHRIETLNAYLFCGHGPHVDEVAFAICDSCGSVSEIALTGVRTALQLSAAAQGFAVQQSHVELHGACGACAENAPIAPAGP